MNFNWRAWLALGHDVAACAAAWLCAYWLRFTPELPDRYLEQAFTTLSWVIPVHAALFWSFGLYRGIWRYASLPDLRRILVSVGAAAVAVPTLMFMLQIAVPRSVLIMMPILLMLIMGGSRVAYRAWKERMVAGLLAAEREPVLVLGSGEAAVNLIKDFARSSQWRVVGVLDDDAAMIGRQLHGVNVLGRLNEIPRWQRR
ncbi:MAG: nucleoside-diphosphate sugar epimerase/dehydratase [Burkholderiales bacterium]